MTMTTTLTHTGDQAPHGDAGLMGRDHPLTFVLLLVEHGARRHRESAARRQRRQFRQRRPRLMLVR